MSTEAHRPRRMPDPTANTTPERDVRRGALVRVINTRLPLCSLDELRVMDYVLSRLELGRDRYGLLDLERGDRDWAEEERQEHADAAVYRACAEIVRLDRVHRDLRELAGKELIEAGLTEIVERAPMPGVRIEFDVGGES